DTNVRRYSTPAVRAIFRIESIRRREVDRSAAAVMGVSVGMPRSFEVGGLVAKARAEPGRSTLLDGPLRAALEVRRTTLAQLIGTNQLAGSGSGPRVVAASGMGGSRSPMSRRNGGY